MKKILILAMMVLGTSLAQAQHVPGATTLQVFPSTAEGSYTLMIMGNKAYVPASYVSAIGQMQVVDLIVEPGQFYTIRVEDDKIVGIVPAVNNNAIAYTKLFAEKAKQTL